MGCTIVRPVGTYRAGIIGTARGVVLDAIEIGSPDVDLAYTGE